jgi:hypothetical protein
LRVAQRRPDLLRKLGLAEPGGDLDTSLTASDPGAASRPPLRVHVAAAAEKTAGRGGENGVGKSILKHSNYTFGWPNETRMMENSSR